MEGDGKNDEIFFEVRCPSCKTMVCEVAGESEETVLRLLCKKCKRKNNIHLQHARKRNNIRKSDPLRVAA